MYFFGDQSVDSILQISGMAINNTLHNKHILTKTSNMGYDEEKLKEGEKLYEKADDLHYTLTRNQGEESAAIKPFIAKFNASHVYSIKLIRIIRVLLLDYPDKLQNLGLIGRRSLKFTIWVPQNRQFYQEALKDKYILQILNFRNITQNELRDGLEMVEDAVKTLYNREIISSSQQESITLWAETMDELNEWVYDYLSVAGIVLKDKPKLLEKLGILTKVGMYSGRLPV